MKDFKEFIENSKNFFKAVWWALLYLVKMIVNFIKIFVISPFIPLIDLWKEYLRKIKEELWWFSFQQIWENKSKVNENILIYTLSFVFLLWFTIYSVFWTPYWWYTSFQENRARTEYTNTITNKYFENPYIFQDKYTKDIYAWFVKYNEAYRNRDCDFMKYISVDLWQWEKNYIKNIPIDKKYNEEYIYRWDYKCPSFDKVNEKSFWSPVDSFTIEMKDINDWKDILIIANWFFSDSMITDGAYKWLSKRKITLWKLENWKTWRIHQSITIND